MGFLPDTNDQAEPRPSEDSTSTEGWGASAPAPCSTDNLVEMSIRQLFRYLGAVLDGKLILESVPSSLRSMVTTLEGDMKRSPEDVLEFQNRLAIDRQSRQ